MKISQGDAISALRLIGKNEEARKVLISALKDLEPSLEKRDFDVREMVTGPICDAMFEHGEQVTKILSDGTRISARYTSKIIRDFVMAEDDRPRVVWEPQTTRALLGFVKDARQVLIGGAYIGDQAILLAKQTAAHEGVVHCFEPNADSVRMLATNVAQNDLSNVRINQMGLWAKDEQLVLRGDDSHAAPVVASGEADAFQATSINRYGEEHGIEDLDLIVLDIEGGEIEALKGASNYLSRPAGKAPIIVFEVHASYVDWSNGLENTDIVRLLTDHGYKAFALRDYNSNVKMDGRMIEIIPPEDCYLKGPPHGFNMVAVKDVNVLEQGGFRVVTGVSPKLLKHRDPRLHSPLA